MKQLLQNLNDGKTRLADVPAPQVRRGQLLIRTRASVVSVGTERMLVDFGRANVLQKARQQPEKVKQVLQKLRTDGIAPTLQAVRTKLALPIALGYSNAGVVLAVGAGVEGFAPGDRVVSNGSHAEVVSVPANLCAKIPDGADDEAASFTVIASIALQGIRLAAPTLGETFVVTGLGLIGLFAVQFLRAHGCQVIGIDFDEEKLALARRYGAITVNPARGEDPIAVAHAVTNGRGVDGVLIAASTKSNEPMHQAATMCRKRGRIVLVGVTGLELARSDFYEKELTFQVSCSYGPGRYDPAYEQGGQDYPLGFVRWTEQRNFEAVLGLMADGKLDVDAMITHRFPFVDAPRAYEVLGGGALGVVLTYADEAARPGLLSRDLSLAPATGAPAAGTGRRPRIAVIGAGNYTGQMLLPALAKTDAELTAIASAGGTSAAHWGQRFGFKRATTDLATIFDDPGIDAVVVTTQHQNHAELVCRALRAGKHVFVEKPLAIDAAQLAAVEACLRETEVAPRVLGIGFNRRFAPHVVKMKAMLAPVKAPKSFVMTVNAGAIPPDHWTIDPAVGGGRIIGEGCHFIDLLRFLAGSPITDVRATIVGGPEPERLREDKMALTMTFADGSLGTVHYLANGHKGFPKERLEVFADGRVLSLDNFQVMQGWGYSGFGKMRLWRQDKGHVACIAAFVKAVAQGNAFPIPVAEIVEVTRASFDAVDAVRG